MTSVPRETQAVCPVCKQPDDSTFLLKKEGYDLYKCAECQHIFVWPVPTLEALKAVYSFSNGYQVQNRAIYDDSTDISKKTHESLRQIENFCSRQGRLLDVGCSSGKFLWLAKRHGWAGVYGVELNQDTAQIAKDNGLEVCVGELASANFSYSSFDAIHLGDVIEHVPDPAATISELFEVLESDGVIAIVTPNSDSLFPSLTFWMYRLFGLPWSHVTPPYHLNQFSEKSLTRLLEDANFNVIHRQYQGCSLHYELGETHVLRSFRSALRKRRFSLAVARLIFAVFTAAGYAIAYGVDRCCLWKKKDSQMWLIAKKATSYEEAAEENHRTNRYLSAGQCGLNRRMQGQLYSDPTWSTRED